MNNFEQNEDEYILVLLNIIFFPFSTALQKLVTCFPEDKISYIYPDLQFKSFHAPALNAWFSYTKYYLNSKLKGIIYVGGKQAFVFSTEATSSKILLTHVYSKQ